MGGWGWGGCLCPPARTARHPGPFLSIQPPLAGEASGLGLRQMGAGGPISQSQAAGAGVTAGTAGSTAGLGPDPSPRVFHPGGTARFHLPYLLCLRVRDGETPLPAGAGIAPTRVPRQTCR